VTIAITGDAALNAAYQQFSNDIGMAINATVALSGPIKTLAGQTITTFQALGDVGAGGVSCVAAQASLVTSVQANVSVSVSASASVSGTSS
jgi:enoyl-[acyl-carrier-protein] reductase (NADH)